jgi:hypothetical protein
MYPYRRIHIRMGARELVGQDVRHICSSEFRMGELKELGNFFFFAFCPNVIDFILSYSKYL